MTHATNFGIIDEVNDMKDNLTIYLISGKARHGKTTVANMIRDYYEERNKLGVVTSFNRYIKLYAKDISDWAGKDETKPRKLLQKLGDILREKLDSGDFLVRRVDEDMDIYDEFAVAVMIDDVRLPNEIAYFKNKYPSQVRDIHVERPDFDNGLSAEEQAHITEVGLDNYSNYDYTITNDGTLDELKDKVYKMIGELER